MLLPTSVVGSYPQPEWLIDRERLGSRLPPRVRALEIWRVRRSCWRRPRTTRRGRDRRHGAGRHRHHHRRRAAPRELLEPLRDRTRRDRHREPGVAIDRTGHPNPVPRIVGPIGRRTAVEMRDVEFLRAQTDRPIKITLPGPFTMSQQAQNDYYADPGALAMAYAAAVNEEARDCKRGRRGRDPDRRALPAGAPGDGARVRARGHQPARSRESGGHRAAHLLRLRHVVHTRLDRVPLPS